MSTYDPKQMALDALSGADPPPHSGLTTFVSEEGVWVLAGALETALDGDNHEQWENKRLGDEVDSLQDNLNKANDKLESVRDFLENEELTEDVVEKLLKIIEGPTK